MRKKYLIIAFVCTVLVQLAFPLKMIFDRELILLRGETFLMKIEPIDPYDAFRGRYVSINYTNVTAPIPWSMQQEHYKFDHDLFIPLKKAANGEAIYQEAREIRPTDTDIYLRVTPEGPTVDYETVWIDIPDKRYYMNEYKAPIADRIIKDAYAQIVVYMKDFSLERLKQEIFSKKSFLCVGLDVDLNKIPPFLLKENDPIFAFNKAIIDATHPYTIAYKPNIAFYEAYGEKGWQSLRKTIDYLNEQHPHIFTIADAKRGDIGNTATMYAKAFFEDLQFDSVTVAPYMGQDSVEPFLAFEHKATILLALTSNKGAFDFQTLTTEGAPLYQQVLTRSQQWHNAHNLMYVVGATKAEYLADIRRIVPQSFLLVPGVGAQGGDLKEVCKYGLNDSVGLIINASRAHSLQKEMAAILQTKYPSL